MVMKKEKPLDEKLIDKFRARQLNICGSIRRSE